MGLCDVELQWVKGEFKKIEFCRNAIAYTLYYAGILLFECRIMEGIQGNVQEAVASYVWIQDGGNFQQIFFFI